MGIEVKKVNISEINQVFEIIENARAILKKDGCAQWQDGNPNIVKIRDQIINDNMYGVYKNGVLSLVGAIISGEDPSYKNLYSGEWQLYTRRYLTVHSFAVKAGCEGQGLYNYFFEWLFLQAKRLTTEVVKSIRIDTHDKNERMKHIILKEGFIYCGIVYISDLKVDRKRNVYERVL